MKFKINRSLVPIKAHFFFFFAALGPILPQLNVFGRQLGIPPDVMGMITAVLPLLWAVAKPLFGYIVDFWPNYRKLIFMLLITLMTASYCGLWFIPIPAPHTAEPALLQSIYHLNNTVYLNQYNKTSSEFLDKYTCHWSCTKEIKNNSFDVYLSNNTYINTLFIDEAVDNTSCSFLHMYFDEVRAGEVVCTPKRDCDLLCYEYDVLEEIRLNRTKRDSISNMTVSKEIFSSNKTDYILSIDEQKSVLKPEVLYTTGAFWSFVVLMSVGTVAFNVANCIGDAVCFDVLGPEHGSRYGSQRAWGTAGYGLTALAGGWLVELLSGGGSFAPAFLLALVATAVDLFSCTALTLPPMSSPNDSGAALRAVLKMPRVLLFIMFACIAGIFDSFIIYYMFWFLEEMAEQTGHTDRIKLIEGIVVAGQSFFGEILFFALSGMVHLKFLLILVRGQMTVCGRIIERLGYGVTFTFCLFCYGARMALISLIHDPWHLVFIESVMQGPTYALCYATIAGYAASAAPAGYSATVQGVVAGADDGLGFALGSLIGGQAYRRLGGRGSFRLLSGAAVAAAIAHAVLYAVLNRQSAKETPQEPAEVQKMFPVNSGAIYRDTVEPAPMIDSSKR